MNDNAANTPFGCGEAFTRRGIAGSLGEGGWLVNFSLKLTVYCSMLAAGVAGSA
jgi:hypothetical protein